MSNQSDWIQTALLAVPLFGIAGSAIAYVVNLFQDAKNRRRERFFELMAHLDGPGTIAQKLAAIYALRDFKEHQIFVERFCETLKQHVEGGSSEAVIAEFEQTLQAIRKSN